MARVLHVVASVDQASAGVGAAVSGLCTALAARTGDGLGTDVTLAATASGAPRFPVEKSVRQLLFPLSPLVRQLLFSSKFKRGLEQILSDEPPDLVHVHGLWLGEPHLGCQLARKYGIPYVLSPHGMLMKWALAHHHLRKSLSWSVYQKRDCQAASALIVTGTHEARDMEVLRLKAPAYVVPNGIELPPPGVEVMRRSGAVRQVLFFGRIHPVKGLMNLVRAWAELKKARPHAPAALPWRLVIAGIDECGFVKDLEAEAVRCGLTIKKYNDRNEDAEPDIVFSPGASGDARWQLYAESDLFVLPSFMENFGIVAGEALACGVPVVASETTAWQQLGEKRCGWTVKPEQGALASGLREAMGREDCERREMGVTGRQLVLESYTWPKVASAMKAVYENVLNRAGKGRSC